MTRGQQYLLLLIILSLVVLSTTQAVISYNSSDVFIGDESYNTLRLAQEQASTNNYVHDKLQDRSINFSLTNYLLSLFDSSQHGLVKTIFLILGVIATTLIFTITRFYTDNDSAFFTTILFVFNPIYIYYFTSVNDTALSFVLLLISAYFILKQNIIGPLFFVASLFSDPRLAVFSLPIISYLLYKHEGDSYSQLVLYFSTMLYLISPFVHIQRLFTGEQDLLINFLVYFGDSTGNSLTLLSLAILGVIFLWERSFEKNIQYLYFTTLLVTSLYFSNLRLLLLVFMSFFGYKAVSYLYTLNWEFDDLKYATLTVIAAGLLLSTIVFVDNERNNDVVDKINAAKELSTYNTGDVVSSAENGFLISYFSKKPVLLDSHSYLYDDYEDRLQLQNELFFERRSQNVISLLENNDVSYIFIDDDMKQGVVWSSENEGLLFVLQFSSDLNMIIQNSFVSVYAIN